MATFHLLLQEADQRWISTVAQALQLMNSLFGPFTKTYGIGRCAKVRVDLFRDHVPQRKKWLYGACGWLSHGWAGSRKGWPQNTFRLNTVLFVQKVLFLPSYPKPS